MIRKSTLSRTIAVLFLLIAGTAAAQFPHTISYQGVINQGVNPMTGTASLTINYYDATTSVLLYTETFSNVSVTGGVFSLELGSQNSNVGVLFNGPTPIEIGVQIDGWPEFAHTKLSAAPYAFNAYSLLGVPASLTPANNTFFPLPVDAQSHIGTSVLPPATMNGLPLYNNNVKIVAGRNVSVTASGTSITIDGPATPTITSVAGGAGITTSQSNGTVTVRSNADDNQFGYVNNALHLRTDIPVIGTDAHFRSLQVDQDGFFNGAIRSYGLQTGALVTTDAATIGGNLYLQKDLYTSGNTLSIHAPVINFNYGRLTGIPNPLEDQDLANKGYIDQRDYLTSILGGDLEGTTGNAMIDPYNYGVGDRMVEGINLGGGAIVDDRIADDLTIRNGTINASPIGLVEPAAANLTTLLTLEQTLLATHDGRVGIGTVNPQHLLDIQADHNWPVHVQFSNESGSAVSRILSHEGTIAGLEIGDLAHNISAIRTTSQSGMEFSMTALQNDISIEMIPQRTLLTLGWNDNILFTARTLDFGAVTLQNVADPINMQDAATKYYVDSVMPMNGDVIGSISQNTINVRAEGIGDRMIDAVNHATEQISGDRIVPDFGSRELIAGRANLGSLKSSAPNAQAGGAPEIVSDRFADVVTAIGAEVTIHNSLVNSNSVIMLTLEVEGGGDYSGRMLFIRNKQDGQFTVKAGRYGFPAGARVHYMIINGGPADPMPN